MSISAIKLYRLNEVVNAAGVKLGIVEFSFRSPGKVDFHVPDINQSTLPISFADNPIMGPKALL
jgi:hypothetical protein